MYSTAACPIQSYCGRTRSSRTIPYSANSGLTGKSTAEQWNNYAEAHKGDSTAGNVAGFAWEWAVGMPGRMLERLEDPSKRIPNGPENAGCGGTKEEQSAGIDARVTGAAMGLGVVVAGAVVVGALKGIDLKPGSE